MVRHRQMTFSTKDLAPLAPFGVPDNTSDRVDDGLDVQVPLPSSSRPSRVKQRPNIMFCAGAHNPRKSLPGDYAPCSSWPLRVKKRAGYLLTTPVEILAALRVRYRPNKLAALRQIRRYHRATKYVIHEPRSAGSVPETPTSD
jgi:hypothetical protein